MIDRKIYKRKKSGGLSGYGERVPEVERGWEKRIFMVLYTYTFKYMSLLGCAVYTGWYINRD